MSALIREHDWASTPLGRMETWPHVLQTLTRLMLASSQPMFLVWGPELTTIYNDAYTEILEFKHPAVGQPFSRIWHEIWDSDLKGLVARTYAGESVHMDDIQLHLLRKGYVEETHFSFSYTPVRDGVGKVAGFFCACLEITEQVLERRRSALRAELTEHLRASTPSETAFVAAALLAQYLRAEQAAYGEIDEAGEYAYIARDWNDGRMASNAGVHRIADFGAAFAADLKAGITIAIGDVRKDPRTAQPEALKSFEKRGIQSFLNVPFMRHGRLAAVMAIHSREPRHWSAADIALAEEVAGRVNTAVEHSRAETALRASEARFRALVMSTSSIVYSLSADCGEMRVIRGRGFIEEVERDSDWVETQIEPEERQRVRAAIKAAIDTQSVLSFEHHMRRSDGTRVWVHSCAVPLKDARGEITEWFGTATDISERKEAERHQSMLMAELDHRVKNVLAVVQSIALQSFRDKGVSGAEAAERFVGRLTALAHSHALLARNRWEGASLRALLYDALAPCQDQRVGRIAIEGPDILLTPKSAQTLSLAFHELATNSVKYGALSNAEGRVTVAWRGDDDVQTGLLHLSWQESDGPPIEVAPKRSGFGSRLVKQALAFELGGEVALDFERTGLSVTMRLPLAKLTLQSRVGSPGGKSVTKPARPAPISGDMAALNGARVLVVEDEHFVATEMAEMLAAAGCVVVGPVPTLDLATKMAETEALDAAVLDVNLNGELVWPAGERLLAQGVPILLATGYAATVNPPPQFLDCVWLQKPVQRDQVIPALAGLLAKT
ncbi:MAG: HWE histidine kinase domain-containing protein [Gemmobacter sp.]|nr:HWE histidine kinase domain-containing protein [Gemmobacter sp.]